MHTKTHMWGRRCERGVRVLRACAHGASICVAVRRFLVIESLRGAAFRPWTPMLQTCAWRFSRGLLANVALTALS